MCIDAVQEDLHKEFALEIYVARLKPASSGFDVTWENKIINYPKLWNARAVYKLCFNSLVYLTNNPVIEGISTIQYVSCFYWEENNCVPWNETINFNSAKFKTIQNVTSIILYLHHLFHIICRTVSTHGSINKIEFMPSLNDKPSCILLQCHNI